MDTTLANRVARLERANRRLAAGLVGAVIVGGLVVAGGAAQTVRRLAAKEMVADEVLARSFTLIDKKGDEVGVWGPASGGKGREFRLHGDKGEDRIALRVFPDGSPTIDLFDFQGTRRIRLTVANKASDPRIVFYGPDSGEVLTIPDGR